ncbi:MAG: TRAM domain-containing protein [Clostridiales bacterium]|nr:TRAM domain-containing protein [Clostridiales bacterium]
MIKKIIQILFIPMGGALGYWSLTLIEKLFKLMNISITTGFRIFCEIAFVSLMAVVFYFIGGPVSNWLSDILSKITKKAKEMPVKDLFLALLGLIVGLICAFLICQVFVNISGELLVTCINALIYICCGFLGIRVFLMRRDDINIFEKRKKNEKEEKSAETSLGGTILDSSILIDGRAVDIFKTGFLFEPVLIPKFILDELTRLADSEEVKKRTRGRIGLDTVKKLQELKTVKIVDKDYAHENIDAKIINLAVEQNACIMTNDYSLNMVASVQGVKILNINELANALKPTVVAGDELTIEISKLGKDPTQGVGYLDDGTMVVVENGSEYVDTVVKVVVTSMLQTNAGKIIFGKVK